MAAHSHGRGNKGYGGVDRTRGDSAAALPTFEQEAEGRRKLEEAAALLGGDLSLLTGEEETPADVAAQAAAQAAAYFAPTVPPRPPAGYSGRPMKNVTPPAPEEDPERTIPPGPGAEKGELIRIPDPTAPALIEPTEAVYRVHQVDISDLIEDPDNARTHNPANIGMIRDAVHEVGVGRSVVIDENYTLLAGNGAKEACQEAGIRRVLIIETDGETLVAVQRTGLTPRQKTRLALFDNRTTDLSEFDARRITALTFDDEPGEPGILAGIFSTAEAGAFRAVAELAEEDDDEPLRFGSNVRGGDDEGGKGKKNSARREAYRLEFSTAEHKREFDAFLRWLNDSYGPDDSPSGRWSAYFSEHCFHIVGVG